jgi:hypothetical protein
MNPTRPALLVLALAAATLPAMRRVDAPLRDLREVEAPAVPGAGQHNLTVAADGRVLLSWIDALPDTSYALRFAVLGGEWSRPRTISQGRHWFINWADFPALAVTGRVMVAHWLERNAPRSSAYGVRMSRSTDGGVTWSAAVKPHRETVVHGPTSHAYYGFVSLWAEPDGSVGAAWTDSRNTGDAEEGHGYKNLRVTTWSAAGPLGAEVEVDANICDCCQTAAAVTSDGPVVVYRDRTPDEIRDIGIVRRVNGTWTAPAMVAADNWRINACPVNGPAIAAEGRTVAVAWYTAANGARKVRVAFSHDAGATFGAPVDVDDGRPAGRVGVILAGNGALVSWLEDTGAGAEVRVRRVTAAGERGEAQTITRTTAARPSGFPRMVRSGDRVVFAWRDPETSGGARVRTAVARLAP